MKRRLVVALALTAGLSLLLPGDRGTWAEPIRDGLRQTVPTRTPTSPSRTPRPATPTGEVVQDTPTTLVPTGTAQPGPTFTVVSTVAPSETPAPGETIPATGSPTSPPGGGEAWDFGDAPDPGFPSLKISDGARHSLISFEWLGAAVDAEADSRQVDRDLFDDGIVVGELQACAQESLQVGVTVGDRDDVEHPYDAQHLLYLNVLVDWDGDGSWSGQMYCPEGSVASEWAVRNLPIDVSSWPAEALSQPVDLQLAVGPSTGQAWARFTLSYGEIISGEDWDGKGTFSYGETEDRLLTVAEPPSASPGVPTSTTATSVPSAGTPGAVAPGPAVLCFGALLVLLVLLVLVLLFALRRRAWRLALVALAVLLGLPVVTLVLHGTDLEDLAESGVAVPTSASPTWREPLVPTPTPTGKAEGQISQPAAIATPTSTVASAGTAAVEPTEATVPYQVASPPPSLVSVRDRFGFGVAIPPVDRYDVGQLHAGWYLTWGSQRNPSPPQDLEFVQMIRVRGGQASPSGADLEQIARSNPGSLWLVGNEPDVLWQDNSTPEEYAWVYHQVHTTLKGADPTCQVAIGGVSQATPLRLQYLDMVLEAYRERYGLMIPVDVWNVHGFILREERDSWGVDIPPGISAESGRLFEMDDHDSTEIFQEQILAFRRWMKDKGERNKPLIVSEYGILMPADYGFPQERVRDFLYATFDFFLTATDSELGYPADGDRLVQRWAWYSLSDTVYPTGNLFDAETAAIMPLGLAYGSYTLSH
ncbi:MAG TPA: glycosyl hydrolase [Anaerolineae bacterium]|nr:glycosyl hydrolase [Anaerolineae bacterium]